MTITNVKKLSKDTKGNILAFFDVDFGDHTLRDLKLLKNNSGGYFVGSPSRAYEKDGKKSYYDYMVFKEDLKKMITSRAIGVIIKGNQEEKEDEFDDIPF